MGPLPRRALTLFATLTLALVPGSQTAAAAPACTYADTYPGDAAAKAAIAAWMAGGADTAGLPGELPVMAALVESGLKNVPQGDSATAGYFRMRVDIWNSGDYAGFPDHPTLQLQWFIDQAQEVRQRAIAAGDANFGDDPATWGEWVADVERPTEQDRGRYQLRLEDARGLVAAGCAAPAPTAPAPGPTAPSPTAPDSQLIPDSLLPRLTMQAKRYQDAGKKGALTGTAACSNESCLARAAVSVAVPGRGVFRAALAPVQLERGEKWTFRVTLTSRVRKLVATSLRKRACPVAAVRVIGANAGGYRNSASRTVVLGRSARACG